MQYFVYELNKGTDGSFFPFEFCDMMGLKPGSGGADPNNIISILNDQIQEGDRVSYHLFHLLMYNISKIQNCNFISTY